MLVGFFLRYDRKFRDHPYPIISSAIFLQAIYYSLHYVNYQLCNSFCVRLLCNTITFSQALFNDGPIGAFRTLSEGGYECSASFEYEVFMGLHYMQNIFEVVSTYGCITLNSVLFIDLYLTLRNPFFPRKNRVIFYYLFTFVMMLITLGICYYSNYWNELSIKLYCR